MAANLLSIWIPIAVAVIALVYSVRSDRRSHRHNRLSVKPILNVRNHTQNQPSEFTATLVNNGTGPAIITDALFFLDGKPVEQPSSQEEWIKLFRSMGIDIARIRAAGRSIGVEYALRAGVEETLIRLHDFKGEDLDHLHIQTKKALHRLTFQYRYASIYGGDDDGSQDTWETEVTSLH